MRIEHLALNVSDPIAMAEWYGKALGWTVRRNVGGPNLTMFLADSTGQTLVEIYRNPAAPVPDYRSMHPLILHIALVSDDLAGDMEKLRQSGATQFADIETTALGDKVVFMRDPWGLAIQLCKRVTPLL